jgi:ubiquitin-like-conjugating enzyme ATG3
MMDKVGHFLGEGYRDVAKKFMSVLKESKFYEEGVLTPEEFINAGDFLTQKCPTWKWCSAKVKVDYLPEDKQYLQTTVPCPMRVADYEKINKTSERIVEDGWVEANVNFYNRKKDDEIKDIEEEVEDKQSVANNIVINDNYMDIDIVKDENKTIENLESNEEFIVVEHNDDDDNIIKTRTYDVSVTYDFFYRVPRMWLTGYNEHGVLLQDKEINEDIMMEYIDRTVTIEKHPHTSVKSVSIHPCKHSVLLLKMIENFERSGKKLEVHMSILLFLKFLHSVVPTIQYDFTMDINF